MKKSIYLTAQMGCKHWVIHPIMPFGVNDVNTENAPKTLQMNLEFMGEVVDCAGKQSVTVCLENVSFLQFLSATPEKMRELAKMPGDDVKVCLDTGHVAVFKDMDFAKICYGFCLSAQKRF